MTLATTLTMATTLTLTSGKDAGELSLVGHLDIRLAPGKVGSKGGTQRDTGS